MKKAFFIAPLVIALTGCGGAPSVEDMVKDSALLKKTMQKCEGLALKGKTLTPKSVTMLQKQC